MRTIDPWLIMVAVAVVGGYFLWKKKRQIKLPPGRAKYVIGLLVILVVAVAGGFIDLKSLGIGKKTAIEVFDDYPIWLLDGGEVAVYREMRAYEDSFETEIVLANLADEDKDGTYEIYEVIPKEMAKSAAQLKFSKKPEVVEDDPILKFTFSGRDQDKPTATFRETLVDIPVLLGKMTITWGRDVVAGYVVGICETAEAQKWIKAHKYPDEKYDVMPCIRYVEHMNTLAQRSSEEWQRKNLKENEILKSLEPDDDEYKEVKTKVQKAIIESEKPKISNPLKGVGEAINNVWDKTPLGGGVKIDLSEEIFPQTLNDYSLVVTKSPAVAGSCYESMVPQKYVSAFYGTSSEPLVVAITEYKNKNDAQAAVRVCVRATEDEGLLPGVSYLSVDKKDDVAGNPFYMVTTTYEGAAYNAMSMGVLDKYLIVVMYASDAAKGGTESLHRNVMGEIMAVMKGKTPNAPSSPKPTQKSTPKPTVKPTPKAESDSGSCMVPALDYEVKTYYYHRVESPCSNYVKDLTSRKFSMKCDIPSASWRGHWVKEINPMGAKKLTITANLKLIDHAKFFSESGGVGVKYDDYVDLIILSKDPRSMLDSECNKASSASDWAKCAVSNTDEGVLGHCGVPKYESSKACNFTVTPGNVARVYAVLRVADAWAADVEGVLSDMKVCYDRSST